jgi:uncharacterized membrane protein YphA (DoxX/SURF4 family)
VLTVAIFVILRLSLGCHFLYEGLWKIKNADTFSAEPFLTEAKGPAAPLFYAMVDDIDGTKRLSYDVDEQGNPKRVGGKCFVHAERYVQAWERMTENVVSHYGFDQQKEARAMQFLAAHKAALDEYLAGHADEIVGHFISLRQFEEEQKASGNDAPYYRKRAWDRQQDLRREVNGWLRTIDGMGEHLKQSLWTLLDEKQQARPFLPASWNPFEWSRGQQINFAVTYGLAAIGLCLMLGLFTRLAALGGAAFMLFVILTQPSWPTIYPPAPSVVGHALIVNKDFVEMVALLLVASSAAGRWGGLDFFVHHLIVRPWLSKKIKT